MPPTLEDLLIASINKTNSRRALQAGLERRQALANVISISPDSNPQPAPSHKEFTDEQIRSAQAFWDILSEENPAEAIRLYYFFTGVQVELQQPPKPITKGKKGKS